MLPYETLIKIDPENKKPLYEQVAIRLLHLIKNGTIQSGTKLPSSRSMAKIMKLHRKTIISSYDELISQGWVIAKSKSGYYINSDISVTEEPEKSATISRFPVKSPFSITDATKVESIDQKIDLNDIFIDDGLPDPRIAPYKNLLRAYKALTEREYKLKKVNHGSLSGSLRLKEAIAAYLNSRGLNPSTSNILITNGAQMAIYLLGKILVNAGDIFIVSSPGYSLAHSTLMTHGAKVIQVPVDNEGIDIDEIEEICKRQKVKGVYVIPHHHYPTTVTLVPERRIRLLSLAKAYNFAIIEDDYDYDFHYASAPHLPMASYNHNGRVIYIGSLSKCFSASLRLGFIVASDDLINAARNQRKIIDIRGDHLVEQSVAELFENGEMERHLRKSIKIYQERRDYMCTLLNTYLKDTVSYQIPKGGMALWIRFDKKISVEKISVFLKNKDISFNHNIIFSQKDDLNHMRLGFASINNLEISICIETIRDAVDYYKYSV